MSQENVEVFQRAIDAYNRRDIDAFLEAFHPDAEWHPINLVMLGRMMQLRDFLDRDEALEAASRQP